MRNDIFFFCWSINALLHIVFSSLQRDKCRVVSAAVTASSHWLHSPMKAHSSSLLPAQLPPNSQHRSLFHRRHSCAPITDKTRSCHNHCCCGASTASWQLFCWRVEVVRNGAETAAQPLAIDYDWHHSSRTSQKTSAALLFLLLDGLTERMMAMLGDRGATDLTASSSFSFFHPPAIVFAICPFSLALGLECFPSPIYRVLRAVRHCLKLSIPTKRSAPFPSIPPCAP